MATDDKTAPAESTLESSIHESKGQIDDLLKSLGLTPQSTMAEFLRRRSLKPQVG